MTVPTHPPFDLSAIPLFPLPNVVLFPRAVLPLHIFEERYKAMTADALEGNRQIAMALLKPGWEKRYHERPEIEPVVCVGTILSYEALHEGKFNFLLQGHTRARIISERAQGAYRVAHLEPLAEIPATEDDLMPFRDRLMSVFDNGMLLTTVIGRQFRQLITSALPTSDIADLIAFNILDDVAMRQSLLSDGNVAHRVGRIVAAFEALRLDAGPAASPMDKPNMN